jgi:hypothetical protein
LKNFYSGRCLEIRDYRTDDLAVAVQYDCYNGANQRWSYGAGRD